MGAERAGSRCAARHRVTGTNDQLPRAQPQAFIARLRSSPKYSTLLTILLVQKQHNIANYHSVIFILKNVIFTERRCAKRCICHDKFVRSSVCLIGTLVYCSKH